MLSDTTPPKIQQNLHSRRLTLTGLVVLFVSIANYPIRCLSIKVNQPITSYSSDVLEISEAIDINLKNLINVEFVIRDIESGIKNPFSEVIDSHRKVISLSIDFDPKNCKYFSMSSSMGFLLLCNKLTDGVMTTHLHVMDYANNHLIKTEELKERMVSGNS